MKCHIKNDNPKKDYILIWGGSENLPHPPLLQRVKFINDKLKLTKKLKGLMSQKMNPCQCILSLKHSGMKVCDQEQFT